MPNHNRLPKLLTLFTVSVFAFLAAATSKYDREMAIDNVKQSTQRLHADSLHTLPIGRTLRVDSFEVTANAVTIADHWDGGREGPGYQDDSAKKFIIINATYKNLGRESRKIRDGCVRVYAPHRFWEGVQGVYPSYHAPSNNARPDTGRNMLKTLEPGEVWTLDLAYQVPEKESGPAFWKPAYCPPNLGFNLGYVK